MSKLKLEVFESNKEIEPLTFYVYDAVSVKPFSNKQQFMGKNKSGYYSRNF